MADICINTNEVFEYGNQSPEASVLRAPTSDPMTASGTLVPIADRVFDDDAGMTASLWARLLAWQATGPAALTLADLDRPATRPYAHPLTEALANDSLRRWRAAGADISAYHSKALIHELTSLAYPRTSEVRLHICHDITIAAFMFDDVVDEVGEGSDARVHAMYEQCLRVLDTDEPGPLDSPVAIMLRSALTRIKVLAAPGAFIARLTGSLRAFFDGAWQARVRWVADEEPITGDTYLSERYYDVAMPVVLDLIELALDRYVETSNREAVAHVSKLRRLCTLNVALTNDIVSYPKEVLRQGQTNNLIAILQHHSGLSLAEATSAVIYLAEVTRKDFAAAAAAPVGQTPLIEDLAQGMRDWMVGSCWWHWKSLRYA